MSPRPILMGVPYDASSSFLRGPALAPALIRSALASPSSNQWSESLRDLSSLGDAGDVELAGDISPVVPTGARSRDRGTGFASVRHDRESRSLPSTSLRASDSARDDARRDGDPRALITAAAEEILKAGDSPLTLGGDHSITYPLLRAFRASHPRLTILHIDAHADLYDEYEGDRFSHACPFARVMENALADRLVQVGVRTLNAHQRAQAARFGVEVIDMRAFASGQRPDVDGPVYLSLDLDALDPAFAPGVSHWEPGGLTTRDVITMIQTIGGRLVGADVVEYNPLRDPTGVTAMVAAKFVKEIASRMINDDDRGHSA